MKTIFIEILLVALFAASSTAQTDSVIKTKDVTISYFRIYKYKTQDSDSIFQRGGFAVLTAIERIKFLNNDSLILKNDENYSVGLKTNDLKDIEIRKEGDQIVTGVVFGGLAGCSLGLFSVYYISTFHPSSYDDSKKVEDHTELNMILGVVIGTVVGSAIGAVIGYYAGYKTLNLYSVADKDKKAKLIKFLRQK